jgi:hypothetical protein
MAEEGSVVFTGHRPLGYVSNHVPLVTRYITRRCTGDGLELWVVCGNGF